MSKYRLYLTTEDYQEINEISEEQVNALIFNYKVYTGHLANDVKRGISKGKILEHFKTEMNLIIFPTKLIVNHVDKRIEIEFF